MDGRASASAHPQPLTPRPRLPATDLAHEPLSYTPSYLAEKILTSRSALEGERKQVTVLFCDLATSTALAEHIGPGSHAWLVEPLLCPGTVSSTSL